MKKTKKIIVIAPLLLLLIAGVFFAFNVVKNLGDKKSNEVEMANKKLFIVAEDPDWKIGEWTVTGNISAQTENLDVTDSEILLTPDGNQAKAKLTLTGNLYAESLAEDIEPGSLYFEFSRSILPDSDYSLYEINDNGEAEFYNSNDGLLYTVNFGSNLPYCNPYNSDCSSDTYEFYWYLANGKIYISNAKTISAAEVQMNDYNFSISITYTYSANCTYSSQSKSFDIRLYVGDYDYSVKEYTTSASSNEEVSLDNILGEEPIIHENWLSKWGSEETEYDFYVEYLVSGRIEPNFEYSLYLDAVDMNGTLVAYSKDGSTYYLGDSNAYYYDSNNCAVISNGPEDVFCSFIVGYKLNGASSLNAQFRVAVSLESESQFLDKRIDFSTNYTSDDPGPGGDDPAEVEYPEGFVKDIIIRNNNPAVFEGSINKLKGSNLDFEYIVESGTGSINKTSSGPVKAFNLWNSTNEGTNNYTVSITSPSLKLDSSYSTDTNLVDLNSSDYSVKAIYFQDDIEYNYVLNAQGNEYILEAVNDYSTYTSKNVYISVSGGSYQLVGTYKKDASGAIVYTALDDRTTSNSSVGIASPVVLPADVTSVMVEYTGTRAAVYMGVNTIVTLKSGSDLNSKIENMGDSVVLKNDANLLVEEEVETTKRVSSNLTKIDTNGVIYATKNVLDKTEVSGVIYDDIKYENGFYETIQYTSNVSEVSGYLQNHATGTFYVLLPLGGVIKDDIVVKTYGNKTPVTSNTVYTENYDGTGRTLATVTVTDPVNNNYYDSGTSLNSGFMIEYEVLYSLRANQDYGTTLNLDVAYYSANVIDDLFINAASAPSTNFSSTEAQTALNKLFNSNTEKRTQFTHVAATVEPVSITVGSYTKEVKNSLDTTYSANSTVVESNTYNYKLQYSFASEYEEITNLLFVDKLESTDQNSSEFKGFYNDVDVSYLERNGVSVTVYYSTDANVDINNVNLNDWSTTKPVNTKQITAVAVSCGNHVFKGREGVSPNITITMTAPNSYTEEGLKSYNNSFITYNNVGSGEVKRMTSGATEVELKKANISVEGTTSLGIGTEASPVIVADNYSYSFIVKNNDTQNSFKDIVLSGKLPVGLELDNVTDSNLTYDADSRTISYSVSNLDSGAQVEISFDTKIVFEDVDSNSSFMFEYNISSLNGTSYNGEVKKLYNKLELPTLEFNKYAKTSDTSGFSDEAVILINKGETYRYRISVKNTSDVIARDILVVDNVPEGLTVSNINNSGVFDGNKHQVTWNVATLTGGETINLEYDVKVSDDINLGTKYRSSGHVTLMNPLSADNALYDTDTNIVSTLYQMASDVKVKNTLVGALADSNKVFNYEASFEGSTEDVGIYDVNDASGSKIGELNINNEGQGSYNFTLKGGEAVEFKLLPGSVNYVIKQKEELGYETIINNSTSDGVYTSISGITNEERKVEYEFKNKYDVSKSVILKVRVKYEHGLEADMFRFSLTGDNVSKEAVNDDTGLVHFTAINYNNEKGQYTYNIKQVDTGVNKVIYDESEYKAVVNVTDDGEGNLDASVKYYDASNNEVEEVVFENSYLPNGLVIKNINNSDYIDEDKVFNYELSLSSQDVLEATYKVLDTNNQELEAVNLVDGSAVYTFTLKSNESISIIDLPANINYVIKQTLVDYYTSTVLDSSYSISDTDNVVVTEGTTTDGNSQIKFNNKYVTSGSFAPSVKITLEGKELEDEEFVFMITDTSEGMTNGFTLTQKNNALGEIEFQNIEYSRPGTYTYEITQLSTNSNHIYYDTNKILLTVKLTDNGDGTMEVLGSYQYFNDEESFINRYSEEPIVSENEGEKVPQNPNTLDRTLLIVILFIIVSVLFVIERRVRQRRYALKV